jgi:hypothetical protein
MDLILLLFRPLQHSGAGSLLQESNFQIGIKKPLGKIFKGLLEANPTLFAKSREAPVVHGTSIAILIGHRSPA